MGHRAWWGPGSGCAAGAGMGPLAGGGEGRWVTRVSAGVVDDVLAGTGAHWAAAQGPLSHSGAARLRTYVLFLGGDVKGFWGV